MIPGSFLQGKGQAWGVHPGLQVGLPESLYSMSDQLSESTRAWVRNQVQWDPQQGTATSHQKPDSHRPWDWVPSGSRHNPSSPKESG